MIKKAEKWFCVSSGLILAVTGAAKVWSACGNSKLLSYQDPILRVQFSHLILTVGILEIAIAALCVFGKMRCFLP